MLAVPRILGWNNSLRHSSCVNPISCYVTKIYLQYCKLYWKTIAKSMCHFLWNRPSQAGTFSKHFRWFDICWTEVPQFIQWVGGLGNTSGVGGLWNRAPAYATLSEDTESIKVAAGRERCCRVHGFLATCAGLPLDETCFWGEWFNISFEMVPTFGLPTSPAGVECRVRILTCVGGEGVLRLRNECIFPLDALLFFLGWAFACIAPTSQSAGVCKNVTLCWTTPKLCNTTKLTFLYL